MSVKATALKLNINVHTAQGWVSKNNKKPQECVQRSFGSGRPVGRPPVLIDEHTELHDSVRGRKHRFCCSRRYA